MSTELLGRVIEVIHKISDNPLLLGKVKPDTHLFEDAVVDSLGAVLLINEIEAEFGIAITDEETFSEEFTTPRGIACLIARHLSA